MVPGRRALSAAVSHTDLIRYRIISDTVAAFPGKRNMASDYIRRWARWTAFPEGGCRIIALDSHEAG